MPNNVFTKYIKNLSFFRISGIRKFIILDIDKDVAELNYVQIKEPFCRINKSKLIESINLLFSENIYFGNDLSIVTEHLKQFVKKYELEEAYLIIGINDFRFKTIKLLKDAEENELWFEENTDKFLPEGRVSDDFIFSYEKYFEDEDNDYYYLVIARRNYIESIISACQVSGITIIKISPFSLQLHFMDSLKEKFLLFLNIGKDKIIYTFSDNKQNLIYGEIFLSFQNISTEDSEAKNTIIKNGLSDVKQNIIPLLNEKVNELNIFITSSSLENENNITLVNSIFLTEYVNPNIFNTKHNEITPAIVLNNLFTGQDDYINLLPTETETKNREVLEKKTSLRITLAFGVVLIFMLLFTYLGENIISSMKINNENKLVEVDSKTKMLETYENENSKLLNNLSMLSKLKGKRVIYSKVLLSLIDGLDNKSCFTDLSINETNNELIIKIEGLAYSQQNVTVTIENVENLDNFKDVSLEYANSVERAKYNKARLPQNTMIEFALSAKYNEN